MSTNNLTYNDRLAGLVHAGMSAVEAAVSAMERGGFSDEQVEIAYVNLWDTLLAALIEHADCDHADLLGIVAGTLQMRVPVPTVCVPTVCVPAVKVPVVGVVGPDGSVSWNSAAQP
jgi:hypothetical protein